MINKTFTCPLGCTGHVCLRLCCVCGEVAKRASMQLVDIEAQTVRAGEGMGNGATATLGGFAAPLGSCIPAMALAVGKPAGAKTALSGHLGLLELPALS